MFVTPHAANRYRERVDPYCTDVVADINAAVKAARRIGERKHEQHGGEYTLRCMTRDGVGFTVVITTANYGPLPCVKSILP